VANEEHLAILRQGVEAWNAWRKRDPEVYPDLRWVDLHEADLRGADLRWVDLHEADLAAADLYEANLLGATLADAYLFETDLSSTTLAVADLRRADLRGASLVGASLFNTTLVEADLRGADLSRAVLVSTRLEGVKLTGARVYGVSAWDITVDDATEQADLVITPKGEPAITVDNLEVAQFVYLLLNNQRLRHVIDTITSKVVLILGRFTPERKAVLDALRAELRKRDYLPILFDFDKPTNRDLTETVSTLAHMARFVVADITEAKSIPQELQATVPNLLSVPVQPLLQAAASEWGMYEHFSRYPQVLPVCAYERAEDLLATLAERVIAPAERKAKDLQSPAAR
jgi:Pentapeptide repeats (8 copies)